MNNENTQLDNLKIDDLVHIRPEHDYGYKGIVKSINKDQRKAAITVTEREDADKNRANGAEVEEHFHNIESINGAYVLTRLFHYNGHHPAVDNLVKIGSKYMADDQASTLWSGLQIMAREAKRERREVLRALTMPIQPMVEQMQRMGEYSGLFDLGREIMRAGTVIKGARYENLDEFEKTMLEMNRVRYDVSNMSIGDLRAALMPQAADKYLSEFPVTKEKTQYRTITDRLEAEEAADELVRIAAWIADSIKRKDNAAFSGRAEGVKALMELLASYVDQEDEPAADTKFKLNP